MDAIGLPVGTVPLYEAFALAIEKYGAAVNMPAELLFEITERQCAGRGRVHGDPLRHKQKDR